MSGLSQEEIFEIFYGSDEAYRAQREAEGWELMTATATLVSLDGKKEHEARVIYEFRLLDEDDNGEAVNFNVLEWLT